MTPDAIWWQRFWSMLVQVWFVAYSVQSGQSHYLNQCLLIINWTSGNKHQWNLNQNTKFVLKYFFENVYKITCLFFRSQCINRWFMPITKLHFYWPPVRWHNLPDGFSTQRPRNAQRAPMGFPPSEAVSLATDPVADIGYLRFTPDLHRWGKYQQSVCAGDLNANLI